MTEAQRQMVEEIKERFSKGGLHVDIGGIFPEDVSALFSLVKEQEREIERIHKIASVEKIPDNEGGGWCASLQMAKHFWIGDGDTAEEAIDDLHAFIRSQHERAEKAEAELADIREDCPCAKMQDHFKDTPREAVRYTVSQLINISVFLKKAQERIKELEGYLERADEHTEGLLERIKELEAENGVLEQSLENLGY